MKLPLINGVIVDLDDDMDLYFFHEYLQWQNHTQNKLRIEKNKSIDCKFSTNPFSCQKLLKK